MRIEAATRILRLPSLSESQPPNTLAAMEVAV